MALAGNVAIVSGGSAGIGRAAARLLVRDGARVVIAGRTEETLEQARDELRALGGDVLAVRADLTRAEDAAALVRQAVSAYGRVELALNAAGGGAGVAGVADLDETAFDEVVAANLKSVWLALKYEIPALRAAGGGAIVNVSSRAGLVGVPNGAAYAAAKHGVIGLTKSAALETAGSGIRVNAVCPGPTRTGQFERTAAQLMPDVASDEAAVRFGATVPLGRIATPEEVAAAAVWLLGEQASFMTGAVVAVDGGATAG